MLIQEFIENYKTKKFMVTKNGVDERSEWIRKTLNVKEYIPFRDKRKIAEMVAEQNIKVVDGIKKYDSIDGYVSLMVASIATHTSLKFSDDPISDYDLLVENGLLSEIIAEFADSHAEIDLLLHMALDMEMEDNETSAIVARFLNKILGILDNTVDAVKDKFENFDLKDILGADIKPEDLAKLTGLLDKIK